MAKKKETIDKIQKKYSQKRNERVYNTEKIKYKNSERPGSSGKSKTPIQNSKKENSLLKIISSTKRDNSREDNSAFQMIKPNKISPLTIRQTNMINQSNEHRKKSISRDIFENNYAKSMERQKGEEILSGSQQKKLFFQKMPKHSKHQHQVDSSLKFVKQLNLTDNMKSKINNSGYIFGDKTETNVANNFDLMIPNGNKIKIQNQITIKPGSSRVNDDMDLITKNNNCYVKLIEKTKTKRSNNTPLKKDKSKKSKKREENNIVSVSNEYNINYTIKKENHKKIKNSQDFYYFPSIMKNKKKQKKSKKNNNNNNNEKDILNREKSEMLNNSYTSNGDNIDRSLDEFISYQPQI